MLTYIYTYLFRAIYFAMYAKTKKGLAKGYFHQDSKLIHVFAGAAAGESSGVFHQ